MNYKFWHVCGGTFEANLLFEEGTICSFVVLPTNTHVKLLKYCLTADGLYLWDKLKRYIRLIKVQFNTTDMLHF